MKLSSFAPSVVTASAPRATASSAPSPASQARSGYHFDQRTSQKLSGRGKRYWSSQELFNHLKSFLYGAGYLFPDEKLVQLLNDLGCATKSHTYLQRGNKLKFKLLPRGSNDQRNSYEIILPSVIRTNKKDEISAHNDKLREVTQTLHEIYNLFYPGRSRSGRSNSNNRARRR
jgi:hypothetical protein